MLIKTNCSYQMNAWFFSDIYCSEVSYIICVRPTDGREMDVRVNALSLDRLTPGNWLISGHFNHINRQSWFRWQSMINLMIMSKCGTFERMWTGVFISIIVIFYCNVRQSICMYVCIYLNEHLRNWITGEECTYVLIRTCIHCVLDRCKCSSIPISFIDAGFSTELGPQWQVSPVQWPPRHPPPGISSLISASGRTTRCALLHSCHSCGGDRRGKGRVMPCNRQPWGGVVGWQGQ